MTLRVENIEPQDIDVFNSLFEEHSIASSIIEEPLQHNSQVTEESNLLPCFEPDYALIKSVLNAQVQKKVLSLEYIEKFEKDLLDLYPTAFIQKYSIETEKFTFLVKSFSRPDLVQTWKTCIIEYLFTYQDQIAVLIGYSTHSSPGDVITSNPVIYLFAPDEWEKLKQIREEYLSLPAKNPDILSVDESTSRFSGALWYNKIQEKDVLLAGCGGIGSYIAFLLGRLKLSTITIYDPDTVETVNMAGQFFRFQDVGTPKVRAVCNNLVETSNYYSVSSYQEYYTITSLSDKIMICGFDNMIARKTFFNNWLKAVKSAPLEERKKYLFIDGRLAAEELQVLAITGDADYNIKKYQEEWLFNDSEAEETTCSYKQTTFMANMIGSLIVNVFVNFVANECEPVIERDVPFYTYYSAETMFFKSR